MLANDIRSTLGANIRLIEDMTGLNMWGFSTGRLKSAIFQAVKAEVPDQDTWRLPYLTTLLERRSEAYYNDDKDIFDYLHDLICSLVST